MEQLIQAWSGMTLSRYDHPSKTWMFIAISSLAMRRSAGGTRLKNYATPRDALADAMRLARAMNHKYVMADLPFNGAKAVLAIPPDFEPSQREGLLSRYGQWLNSLGRLFTTGGDLGTTQEDMIVIARHFRGVGGIPQEMGGSGDLGLPTAQGVFYGIQASCMHLYGNDDLHGKTVLVQGVGDVGAKLVDLLLEAGCDVKFSDVHPERITYFRDERGLTYIEADAVYAEACDIFAPCATGEILNEQTIPQLATHIVVGSANNQLATDEDGERLHDRGILYAPDYIVNAGAVIYDITLGQRATTEEDAHQKVRSIADTLLDVLQKAQKNRVSPAHMADQIASQRAQEREASSN